MATELRVLDRSNDVRVGAFRNVLMVHFRERTPAGCVAAWQAAMPQVAKGGQKAVFFSVVEPASVPPDEEARRAFTRFFEERSAQLAAFVMAVQGEGFRAAMVRTIVAGVLSVLPRRRFDFARHVVPTLDEAAKSAPPYTPGTDAAALLAAFRELAA